MLTFWGGNGVHKEVVQSMRGSRLLANAALVAAMAIAAGCGTSNSDTSSGSSTTSSGGTASVSNPTATPGINEAQDPKIAGEVPTSLQGKSTLVAASDATYAPMEFIASDGKTVLGADTDFAKAIGQVIGIPIQMQNAGFNSILPGLAAGKYDMGLSSFTITKERENTVDFVSYMTAGESFFVKADGGPDIHTLADLCGHTVAAESGTIEASDAAKQGKRCTAAGKDDVTVSNFPDENAVNLALSSGRADVAMADTPPAAYAVEKSNGQFKLSGKSFGNAPYGIALPKGNGMAKPMQAAVAKIMSDGTYKKILDYWGLSQAAISGSEINPTDVPAS
jgi:polar amino acid transport system substrate-binding protein